jgi:hypothetical protein
MTQLMLDFDPEVIKEVEKLAAESGTTVSAVVEQLIREKARKRPPQPLGPLTRQISGIIDLPADVDYRDIVADAMIEKYNSIQ